MTGDGDDGRRVGVGVIGCGDVFPRYIQGMRRFAGLEVVRCADIDGSRAERAAKQAGLSVWGSVEELLADPAVDIAVNITPPSVHAAVTMAALDAGKHVYVEKPLAATLPDAAGVLARAEATGRRLGVAPDTFLGSACQTARSAIDQGLIGRPVGVTAFLTHNRAETWHPDPTFLFKPGGGPVLDMGPYYLSWLVTCLGPVMEVIGATTTGSRRRQVTTPGRLVDTIDVEVATHASAVLRFASGAVGTAMMSFDVWDAHLPSIEIYGTQGTLSLPDPNGFDGDVLLKRWDSEGWRLLPPVTPPGGPDEQRLRGRGVADLAASLSTGVQRATGALAYHVLEVLTAIETSSRERRVVVIGSTCDRPEPV
ncbi:Gfo/Idh/MocA family protein [Planotetraspora sp. GP83]|uniref:Gfo/Idh/MocA family protein n=1 Tax=Planotetraspora sp. GP83 TaxID=3156264 RepID=UPI003513AD27